jgi:hypothetical protein
MKLTPRAPFAPRGLRIWRDQGHTVSVDRLRVRGLPPVRALAPGLVAALAAVLTGSAAAEAPPERDSGSEDVRAYADPTGSVATFNVNGPVNEQGAFFQSLGTNGRSCSTCHVASQGMSMSAQAIRMRFLQTRGQDPLFAAIDGANCPNARPAMRPTTACCCNMD